MPIIDPKTNLRNLSYKEFGTTGDPLVVKDIPDVNKDGPSKGVLKQVTARTDDATRMTRLLVLQGGKRNPAGNKFTANLALLNQQESIEKAKKGEFRGLGSSLLGGALDTGKTIASILAQVPVAGTGTHFVNGGKVGKEYLKGGGGIVGTFLRSLVGADGLQGHERVLAGRPITVNRESVDQEPTSLKNRYTDKIRKSSERGKPGDDGVGDQNLRQPFRLIKNNDPSSDVFKTRLTLHGDPGSKTSEKVDKINESDIITEEKFAEQDLRGLDTIPFYIEVYDPTDGGKAQYIFFRAYLSSLSDDFQGQWNSTKYVGRAEELYNYSGFSRGISFGFNLAAQTRVELQPLYNKLNLLVGTTAPSYNQNQSFMRGVFTKVTIGDYLQRIPGFFSNISINWNTNYPWEIGLDENYRSIETIKVPHLLDVTVQFQPVHDFNPEISKPFIAGQVSRGLDNANGLLIENLPIREQAQEKNTRFGNFVKKTAANLRERLGIEEQIQDRVKTVNLSSEYTELDNSKEEDIGKPTTGVILDQQDITPSRPDNFNEFLRSQ